MTVITKTIEINSKGENDMVDITDQTSKAILESKLEEGIVTIFVPGSTAAVTTIEYFASSNCADMESALISTPWRVMSFISY